LPQEHVKELDKQFKEYQKNVAKNRESGFQKNKPLIKEKVLKKRKRSE